MPDVINLGQFGDPHPSSLSGLSDALYKGKQLQLEQQKNLILMKIAQNKNATAEDIANMKDDTSTSIAGMKNATDLKKEADKKSYESLKLQKQGEDMDFKHAQKLLEDHTMATAYMDPQKKAEYDAAGHGEQIDKAIANGLGISPKDVPELSPIDVIKNSLNKTKADYIAAVRSGKPVPKPLQDAFNAIQTHGVDDTAIAVHMAASDPRFLSLTTKEEKAAAIQDNIAAIKQARSGETPAQDPPVNKLSSAIVGDQGNSNDPLGILKYLKPGNN